MKRILILALLLSGCSVPVESGLLDAPTISEFNSRLKAHGPMSESEVSSLEEALRNGSPTRQHNAMRLLACVRGSYARHVMADTAGTTKDPELWRLALQSLWVGQELGHEKVDPAILRADMIDLGLASTDPELYRAGFRAAAESNSPKLAAELPKALKTEDGDLFALAVVCLTPEEARKNMGLLEARLPKAHYNDLPPLAMVLIKAGAGEAVVNAYPKINERGPLLNYLQEHAEPEVVEFLMKHADKDGEFAKDAFAILVGQVIWGAPCPRRLMEIACHRIEKASLDPQSVSHPKHDQESEMLITHLLLEPTSKLRPDFEKLYHGSEALKQSKQWLKDHP